MARSFAKLELDQNATAQDVEEVLRDYVNTGAAVSARVVIALVIRTNPNAYNRGIMKELALKGACDQARRHFGKEASEYQEVLDFL